MAVCINKLYHYIFSAHSYHNKRLPSLEVRQKREKIHKVLKALILNKIVLSSHDRELLYNNAVFLMYYMYYMLLSFVRPDLITKSDLDAALLKYSLKSP